MSSAQSIIAKRTATKPQIKDIINAVKGHEDLRLVQHEIYEKLNAEYTNRDRGSLDHLYFADARNAERRYQDSLTRLVELIGLKRAGLNVDTDIEHADYSVPAKIAGQFPKEELIKTIEATYERLLGQVKESQLQK